MAELTDIQQMSDAEGDAWDALHDDPNVICTCDGCNFYSPTYAPEGECSLTTHIKAISSVVVREHVTAALDEIEAVVRHWERHPALRRGTAAAEMRRALHRAKEQGR